MDVRRRRVVVAAAALVGGACASLPRAPDPLTAERARHARTYSAELSVRLSGPKLRARTRALVAFERPARLRVEVPGPGGARLLALARGERLLAVFPAERAVLESGVSAAEMERVLGVALTPAELMDVLVGLAPAAASRFDVRWGERLPRRIELTLRDGSRLGVSVEGAAAGADLPPLAFAEPAHEGFRRVEADEARGLWSR